MRKQKQPWKDVFHVKHPQLHIPENLSRWENYMSQMKKIQPSVEEQYKSDMDPDPDIDAVKQPEQVSHNSVHIANVDLHHIYTFMIMSQVKNSYMWNRLVVKRTIIQYCLSFLVFEFIDIWLHKWFQ